MLTVAADGGNVTVSEVYNGATKLTKTTHYTVSGGTVTLKATYLDDLEADDYTFTIKTNQGDVSVTVTVEDTTALSIDPEEATFDKNSSGELYDDVAFEITHNTSGVTLTSVSIGETTLTPTTHYTADGLDVTILKTYLETLDVDEYTITFTTNKGTVDAVITVIDTTGD